MLKRQEREETFIFSLLLLLGMYMLFVFASNLRFHAAGIQHELESFIHIVLSILVEALPFVLIGVFVSAVIQLFVTDVLLSRILPKTWLGSLLMASFSGLIFPVCECGVIPVGRRLMRKGVPAPAGTAFMLSVPIINPVVIMSTFYAFSDKTEFVAYRLMMGWMVAFLAGVGIRFLMGCGRYTKEDSQLSAHAAGCPCCIGEPMGRGQGQTRKGLREVFRHGTYEFFDVGRYLILGAVLAAAYQVFVPRQFLFYFAGNPLAAILTLMVFAFLLSLCSEADAFIAATLTGSFPTAAIVAFMVTGPMLDVKNTLMLIGSFKPRFVVTLTMLTIVLIAAAALLLHILLGG